MQTSRRVSATNGARGVTSVIAIGAALLAAPAIAAPATGDLVPTAIEASAPALTPASAPVFGPVLAEPWRMETSAAAVAGEPAMVEALAPAAAAGVVGQDIAGPVDDRNPPPANPNADPQRYQSFGSRVGAVGWETAGIFALLTAGNIGKVIDNPQSFRFQDEGLFGDNTADLGVDKFAHAYNTYLISEILYRRMERKTGGGLPSAVTAAVLGSGLQIYAEVYDGLHEGSGFSMTDVAFNVSGAALSVARNAIPGLKAKLDFRIMIVPNDEFYTFQGKKHFEQQHFLLALKLAGFEGLKRGPLRFLELHVGYHAKDFTIPDRLAGREPKQLPFVGVGFNFAELFRGQTWAAKAVRTTLQYLQPPYTSIHVDLPTGKLSP